ncbi:hypothetical protein V6V89_39725 [Micromonospora sp. CPCC 206061]
MAVDLAANGLQRAHTGEHQRALLVTYCVAQGVVDALEVLQHPQPGVILTVAVEDRPAACSAVAGEDGVDLRPLARHGRPHRQRQPVEVDLDELAMSAFEQRISSWVSVSTWKWPPAVSSGSSGRTMNRADGHQLR